MNLLSFNRGDVLVDEDLPARRNDLGIEGILKDIYKQCPKGWGRLDAFRTFDWKSFEAKLRSAHLVLVG